ncbi:hypothetical protein F4818DRAFT_439997 [Hypoxylon cercidicola]|nr:hypothetical protein F4818DRAFT_439997 [Hypoxylon cercidicola]
MTSYTTGQEPEHMPGSFPETPSEQDKNLASSGSHQRNKLHKPEDPRGWSGEKATRGHQHMDSGVGLTDADRTPYSQTHNTVNSGGVYDSNKAAVTQNREAVPNTTATTTSGTTDYRGVESKLGVMTGAYSRLDNSSNDNKYPRSTSQDPSSMIRANTTGVGAASPATGIATAAPSSNMPENETSSSDRNIVRNGLKQTTNFDHEDPYWGDVPHGTGVYNTVAGHGSSEKPADGSVHTHDPQLNHDQQRRFSVSTSDATTRDETSPRSSSRFREGLAGAGAGAGVGFAASELADKQHERNHENEVREPTTGKHETSEAKKESMIASLFHRDHRDEDTKHEKKHEAEDKKFVERGPAKDDKPLTDRDAGAALTAASGAYGAKNHADKHDKKHEESDAGLKENQVNAFYQHPNEKVVDRSAKGTTTKQQPASDPFIAAGYTGIISQQPSTASSNTHLTFDDAAIQGHPFTAQTAEEPAQHHASRVGYGLAATGAGAGAGYAAHKHPDRDDAAYRESVTESSYNNPTTTSSTAPKHSNRYTIGQPELGVIAGTAHSSEKQTAPRTSTSFNSSQAGVTHHDKYNNLSGGTSSGIDAGSHYDDKNVVPTSTSNTAPNAVMKDNHTGAKATAAGVSAAGAGAAAAHYAGKKNSDKTSMSETRQSVGPSSTEVREPYMEGATTRESTTSTKGGQHKVLPTGTPSGVNVDENRHVKMAGAATSPTTTSRDAAKGDTNYHRGAKAAAVAGAAGTGTAAAAHHHRDSDKLGGVATSDFASGKSATSAPNPTRVSTDSSHGGQYNMLSSGTPSGINIADHHGDAKRDTTAVVPTTTAKTEPSSAYSAAAAPKKANIAKPAAAATATATGAAPSAATAPSAASGDRVFHRCRKCGEENEITGYFHDKKI